MKINFLFPLSAVLISLTIPCRAQVATPPSRTVVTFSDGIACTSAPAGPPAFLAVSVATRASIPTNTSLTGDVRSTGRLTFDDVVLTRTVDDCSISIYTLFFKTAHLKLVTISLQNFVNGAYREALLISLTDALITSIADTEAGNLAPSERLTLGFSKFTLFDPTTGKTTSFDVSRGI